jgi:hypothetical protein
MNWTCPYCNHFSTITTPNKDYRLNRVNIDEDKYHDEIERGISFTAIACPNPDCKGFSLNVQLHHVEQGAYSLRNIGTLSSWQLLPDSSAKPQPDYIPKQIVDDYTEACRIMSLSPKASATLARRCLQGMIRDFWNINVTSKKLYDEITQLEDKVSASEWEAIDALRSVGNIGAHMKQDIGVIIDVDPEEAALLLEFIEGLLKDWYVARHDREARNKRLKELATGKGEKPRDSKPKVEEESDD